MSAAATIFVKRLDLMASFYAICFGMKDLTDAADDHRVLEAESWTLFIVRVPPEVAASIELSDPPRARTTTPIKLSFDVASIAAARATIAEWGGRVDDHEWEFRGFRHCDFVDPEGNVNQLREAVRPRR